MNTSVVVLCYVMLESSTLLHCGSSSRPLYAPLLLCMVLITGSHCKNSLLRSLYSAKVVTPFKQVTLQRTMQSVMCTLSKRMRQKADSVSLFIKTLHSAVWPVFLTGRWNGRKTVMLFRVTPIWYVGAD